MPFNVRVVRLVQMWQRHSLRRRGVPARSTMQRVMNAADQDTPAATAVRRAAAALRPEIDAVATDIRDAVRERRVEERAGVESTHRTFIAILEAFLDWVEGGRQPELSPDALALARETARAGAGLRVITRGLRVGHRNFLELWDRQLAAQQLPAEVLSEAVARSRDMTFRWIDLLGERLTDEYEAERERLVRSGEAQRARAVAALLAGEVTDPGALSRVLRYELARVHVGSCSGSTPSMPPVMRRRRWSAPRRRSRALLGARSALTLSSTATVTWAWIGAVRAPELDRITGMRTDGVSVAVGEPAEGAAGFRTTHQDASDAQRVARGRGRRAGSIVQYGNVELAAMLVGDLERSSGSCTATLARSPSMTRRRRACAPPSASTSMSRAAAGDAERSGCTATPSANRVQPVPGLLGRPFGERLLELHAALVIAQTLGPPVLRSTTEAR